jgi:dTDP-glucose 4,6-dehydratase
MRILITGGCGFIGHHLVEHLLKNTDWEIVVWDKLTYASCGLNRLRDIECMDEERVQVLAVDCAEPFTRGVRMETGDVDYIVHMAAETHVDRSIEDPEPFVRSNVLGTMRMLDYAREVEGLRRFVLFSTDEVYGPAAEGEEFLEGARHRPSNPYSATKSAAEQLAHAYHRTYGLPVLVVNCMNVFGERQTPEKLVPFVIRSVLRDDVVPIFCSSDRKTPGSRHWLHARNVSAAVLWLLKGPMQYGYDHYNLPGEREVDNLAMALRIAAIMDQPLRYARVDEHSHRPGHDHRYALDGSRLSEAGWVAPMDFDDSLRRTVEWTIKRPEWLEM